MSETNAAGLLLGAIPGATPGKWAERWAQQVPDVPLEVSYFPDEGQLERIHHGTVDIGYLRLPIGNPSTADAFEAGMVWSVPQVPVAPDPDEYHRVWLYEENLVACASADHWIAAADASVEWEDLAEETFLRPEGIAEPGHRQGQGRELTAEERMALEVAAAGSGVVLLPQSVARMLTRKDVVVRVVGRSPAFQVGLCWLRSRDDDVVQEFIGVARGRRASSGRSALGRSDQSRRPAPGRAGALGARPTQEAGGGARRQPRRRQKPESRPGRPPRGRRPRR